MTGGTTAVVLNWNRADLTCRAARSLLALPDPKISVVVVDNGSAGDDVRLIREGVPAARVIALPANVGFARAVNVGATVALRNGAEYVLVFNNDAQVDPGSTVIGDMLRALEDDATLGAAGAVIANDDAAGSLQSSGYRYAMWFPVPRAERTVPGDRTVLPRTGFLSGAAQLVRARAFATIGGFDPDFFLYGDDVDFARRLRTAGFRTSIVATPGIRHARAASIRLGSPAYVYTALRANLILIGKHARWYERPTAFITSLLVTLGLSLLGARHGYPGAFLSALRAWRDYVTHRWGGYDGTRLEPVGRPSLADLRLG